MVRAEGIVERLPHLTKCENLPLRAGDRIRRRSPGGGGLGSVTERDLDLRRHDAEEGYVADEMYRRVLGGDRSPASGEERQVEPSTIRLAYE